MLKRIESVQTDATEGAVHLVFTDGSELELDRNHFLKQGGVFEQLADDEVFTAATTANDGLTLEWPGDPVIDLFAPTLWKDFSTDEDDETGQRPAI